MKLKPIKNNIFFKFVDKLVTDQSDNRVFETVSENGIVMMGNYDDSAKSNRWVEVLEVGPDVTPEIKTGSMICVEALQWTERSTLDGEDFWRTNDEKVLVVRE